jgi:beta-lactamase class A
MKCISITRRAALLGLTGFTASATLSARTTSNSKLARDFSADLAALQARSGGRLGVHVQDTASGLSFGLNSDSRFGMCSTFKLLLAAAVLREASARRIELATVVPYTRADLVAFSPVAERNVDRAGMTIGALAEATQTTSDNTAANLLLKLFGGPAGFTRYLRTLGDSVTRLDRFEPQMNRVTVGDERDTTTPRAMAESTARIVTGKWLPRAASDQLIEWMIATQTGKHRIRAGLPAGWRAGDKTGTSQIEGLPNRHNDVAVAWPPGRKPIVIATYFEARDYFDPMRAEDNAVLADVGRLVTEWVAQR